MLVKVLHTFGNKIEGKRVHKDSIIEVSDARAAALINSTPGRPLVRKLLPSELEEHKNGPAPKAKVERPSTPRGQPGAKVEPDSRPPSKPAPNPRAAIKARTAGPRTRRAVQEEAPAAPRPLVRIGKRGESPEAGASSLPVAPARVSQTTRPRGTRSPKSGGSPSTTPGN